MRTPTFAWSSRRASASRSTSASAKRRSRTSKAICTSMCSAAPVTSTHTRGKLSLDTGSGEVRVTDAQGEIDLDTGSGSVEVANIRGPFLKMDTGSGRVRGDGRRGGRDRARHWFGQRAPRRRCSRSGSSSIAAAARWSSTCARTWSRVRIESGSGGVTLGIPGVVRRRDPHRHGQRRHRHGHPDSGSEGGAELPERDHRGRERRDHIETGSGGVRLRRADELRSW